MFSRTIEASSQEIAAKYESGQTLQEVADEYGVTLQAIWYHLDKIGVERREFDHSSILTRPDVQEKAKQANRKRIGEKNSAYKQLPDEEICSHYKDGKSTAEIAAIYSVADVTIARRLKQAGIKLRRQGYSRKRRCPDGHIVDSRWEYAVDRWLETHNIQHDVHPTVPWYESGSSPQLADFKVGNIYIEVWGIEGNPRYDKRRIEKIKKYKSLGIHLIQIFPHHIIDDDYSPLVDAFLSSTAISHPNT